MMSAGLVAASRETPERRALHQIRVESVRQPSDGLGQPLPLAGVFSCRELAGDVTGTAAHEQVALIQAGRRMIVTFEDIHKDVDGAYRATPLTNEQSALDYVKAHKLPLCLVSTQFERLFYDKAVFSDLPFAENPLTYDLSQELVSPLTVDPFGPVEAWGDLAADWHANSHVGAWDLETFYPDPPFVIMYNNNEGRRDRWVAADDNYRYDAAFGTLTDDEKRREYGDAWAAKYTELFNSWRALLPAGWQDCRFVGYLAGSIAIAGRWSLWNNWTLTTSTPTYRAAWEPEAWSGPSYEIYLAPYTSQEDYQVGSKQVEMQNNRMALNQAQAIDPDYFAEIILWDGFANTSDPELNNRAYLESLGQTYDAARYKGLIQFSLWTMLPRVARDYRNTLESRDVVGFEYLDALLDSVDVVHENAILRRFWRHGALVLNDAQSHPYTSALPSGISSADRWWMLTADVNPAQPWATLDIEIKVFALARVIGETPNREWLVYAHSPLQARENVVITVPGYGGITVDVAREGSFYLVNEAAETVTAVLVFESDAGPIDVPSLFSNGVLYMPWEPNSVYTDTGLTTPATFNQAVRGWRDLGGLEENATADAGQGPIYGRRPCGGTVRNLFVWPSPGTALFRLTGGVGGGAVNNGDGSVTFDAADQFAFQTSDTSIASSQVMTLHVLLSGSGTVGLQALNGGGSGVGTVLSIELTGTPTRYSRTVTNNATGVSAGMVFLSNADTPTATVMIEDFQLELGDTVTNYQFRQGLHNVTETGFDDALFVFHDQVDDQLKVTLPDFGTAATVIYMTVNGTVTVLENQTIGAGVYNLPTPQLLGAFGATPTALSAAQINAVGELFASKGCASF